MSSSSLVGSVKDLVGAAETTKAGGRKVGQEMDKDAFLSLLVTQLKNQDPMKPMQDTEFISQMAQFSSLEQMTNMNELMEKQNQFAQLSQASGMIGKTVTLVPPGDGAESVTGTVSEVRGSGGAVKVVVNGEEYDSTTIATIKGSTPTTTPATP